MKIPTYPMTEREFEQLLEEYIIRQCESDENGILHHRCSAKEMTAVISADLKMHIHGAGGNDGAEPIEYGHRTIVYCPNCDKDLVRAHIYKDVLHIVPRSISARIPRARKTHIAGRRIKPLNGHGLR